MITEPIHINDSDFEEIVLQSELPVIVDFWAVWCAPCKMIAPILKKIANEKAGKIIIVQIDVDVNQEWAMKYKVQGIPTTLFFYKGKLVHRQVGAYPEKTLNTIVEQFISIADENKTNT